jgi:thiamine-phosphate pyrophosphorylase
VNVVSYRSRSVNENSELETRNLKLPPVYPITDTLLSGLSHAEQVRRLIAGGATFIQLREKRLPAATFFEDADEAVRIARAAGVKIVINDRVDVAICTGADGVHLGQDDMPVDAARRLMGEDKIIGYSTHSIEQARAAVSLPVDYIAIGPVFATSTKDDTSPAVGLDGVRAVSSAVGSIPLVAIGGINSENIADVLAAGASSAAIISGVVSRADEIDIRMRNLMTAVTNIVKRC